MNMLFIFQKCSCRECCWSKICVFCIKFKMFWFWHLKFSLLQFLFDFIQQILEAYSHWKNEHDMKSSKIQIFENCILFMKVDFSAVSLYRIECNNERVIYVTILCNTFFNKILEFSSNLLKILQKYEVWSWFWQTLHISFDNENKIQFLKN